MSLLALMLLAAAEPETAIEAERAFASDAQQIGQWAAFGKWAADDGVLIGRNVVVAKDIAAALSAQGEPAIPVHWWPSHSYLSCDGNLAVNSGPFFSPMDGTTGRFTTIWQRGEEGWRYLVDMGVELDTPLSAGAETEIVRPDCETEAQVPPPRIVRSQDKTNGGRSEDNSLVWSWTLTSEGRRYLSVRLWNGSIHALQLFVDSPAPEPTQ